MSSYRSLRKIPSLRSIVARRKKGSKYADYASQRPVKPLPAVLAGSRQKS